MCSRAHLDSYQHFDAAFQQARTDEQGMLVPQSEDTQEFSFTTHEKWNVADFQKGFKAKRAGEVAWRVLHSASVQE